MIACANCGANNAADQRFCGQCGTPLVATCPSCGTANPPDHRFCGQCGTALGDGAPAPVAAPAPAQPEAERRLVSVLFADLVGFTTLSEGRDSEEVRELLSRYFDLARTLVARYGGVVEKFIGDAVMAVWGTPTATEDDAERAVRAALDIVASIPELDPGLLARAGVLTGEAAVTIGAAGEGMVAGDLVNTASRVQSAAEPGGVLVGESTRRATEQAIAYESAGTHELKGKAEPVELFRALRVVSGVGGTLKSAGLEAPFVGRDRELKRIKDLFHACVADGRAHLVSVIGVAGIGKSRLGWEFYKYFDGIVDTVWWHRGRCLAYGDGVAYWALADMVRMRCRIAEDDDPDTARQKLHATVHEHLLEPDEQAFVEPRLAQLLGLEERPGADREDLFPAWRMFFERLAESDPCVMAFEDLQWADAGLLDFIEYLLEWSRDHRIYVITFARPELQELRPTWGAGLRSFTSLYLDPLSEDAMRELLDGLAPGLPEQLTEQILARATGVPLYAVETVRMLLDRGLLTQDGPFYRPTGEIEALEVPETLHALIAARLDGLSPDERQLLQNGAVLGKTFTAAALGALAERDESELAPLLAGLVRKEVLGLQADPRSPEHGQYGFLQDLVRHVAYESLPRRERKQRHLAAARHVEHAFADEDEVAEVLAAHYLAAVDAAPDADDAPALRATARDMLARAAERAASLGSPGHGQRYFDRAAALADEPELAAALLMSAGRLAIDDGRPADARERFDRALAIYTQAGDRAAAARVTVGLADVDRLEGRPEQAAERLLPALPALEAAGPSAELAQILAELGRTQVLTSSSDWPPTLERAAQMAEELILPEVLFGVLISRATGLYLAGRLMEARIGLSAVVREAAERDLRAVWFRAQNNLAVVLNDMDEHREFMGLTSELEARARQIGNREMLAAARLGVLPSLIVLGRWAEAIGIEEEAESLRASHYGLSELSEMAHLHCERGEVARAQALLEGQAWQRDALQPDMRTGFAAAEARVLRAQGRLTEALATARRGLGPQAGLTITSVRAKRCFVEAVEAAIALGDHAAAEELVSGTEAQPAGKVTSFLRAHILRFRARLDAEAGRADAVDDTFERAEAAFREHEYVFHLAVTQLEHAEWLATQRRDSEAEQLPAQARETFANLGATPWIERAAAAAPLRQVAAS